MQRRFPILAAILVALNIFLWIAPAGIAMRTSLVAQLFGPTMIRAEVVVAAGGHRTRDYRVDRGIVTTVASHVVTLREQDGSSRRIRVVAATQLQGVRAAKLASLARNSAQVLVVSLASGRAVSLVVESP